MPRLIQITELGAYLTNITDVYCFYWIVPFDSAVEAPITDLSYELQIDTTDNFATINLQTIIPTNAYTYYNGDVVKAFAVKLPKRQQDKEYTYYWRVRINAVNFITTWSDTQSLIIKQNNTKTLADAMLNDLADKYAYNKEASSTNVYKLFTTLARLFDLAKFESQLVADDNCIELVRDETVEENFGALMEFYKSASISFPQYRGMLKRIYDTFLQYSGTEQGVSDIVSAFSGEPPTIIDNARERGWSLGQNHIWDPSHPNATPVIILYDRDTKGFGWTLYVHNSWNATIDKTNLEALVYKIAPAVSKVELEYPTHQHVSALFNTQIDWETCALTNIDATTVPGSVRIKYTGTYTSGTIITPVIDCGDTISIWGILEWIENLNTSGSIICQLSSSINGTVWSNWETITNGLLPGSTPVRRYVKLQITLSTSNSLVTPQLDSIRLNYVRIPGISRTGTVDSVVMLDSTIATLVTLPFVWCDDIGSTVKRGRWNAAQWS